MSLNPDEKCSTHAARKMTSVEVSDHEKISLILTTFLDAAQAAGLPEERAGIIYTDIMERYETMRDGFTEALLRQIVAIAHLHRLP